ncbi:MAG: ATP-binding protein, partial [Sphingomonadales bacterium]
MDEYQIARGMLLRLAQRYPASSPEAKDYLEWARKHASPLLGLGLKDARALRWTALKHALATTRRAAVEPSPPLALAARLAALLDLDARDTLVVATLIAIDRTALAGDLASTASRSGIRLPALVGEVAGFEPHDAERRVRANPLVRYGLIRFPNDWRGAMEVQLRWSLESLLDRQPEDDDGMIEAMVGPRQSDGLDLGAFSHVPDADYLVRLLSGARRERALGVNILIHGPPGTGKTELARRLATEAGLALYGVGEGTPGGYEP